MTIRRLLVANRGEIARRIFRTCRELGIETRAVFSDADEGMPFVREADVAVRIGPAASAESYLVIEKVIEAAKRTGADAIHPGYGFLAENAAFARACADAGIVFVGPGPDAIRAMGLKREAKRTVAAAGVPVVPGYDGPTDDLAVVAAEAARIGYPVLVKASAGGGGKGMRVVEDAEGLQHALAAARREAKAAFGDDTLILEKYVERPRHVEIQVLADAHGNAVYLFERECSIQRRHQKVVEEAPSPAIDEATRRAMGEAAVAAAKAVGYVNAGTVEFILAPDGAFYFLEMNTRLQVEHPVTEMITGLDLVALQIAIAEGAPLPLSQDDLRIDGWSIEARLYAEDVAAGFLPATGTVAAWVGREQAGIRVDAGVEAGDEVSVHYDPMIAKVVAHGPTRDAARRKLADALSRMSLAGITTNRAFLVRVLQHEAFASGQFHTHTIDEHPELLVDAPDMVVVYTHAAAAALAGERRRAAARPTLPAMRTGFRNVFVAHQSLTLRHGETEIAVGYRSLGDGRYDLRFGTDPSTPGAEVRVVSFDGDRIVLEKSGLRVSATVVSRGERHTVSGFGGETVFSELPRFPEVGTDAVAGGHAAPMPGKVVQVHVAAGDAVSAGDALAVMEAMKMEHTIRATEDGVVAQVNVAVGDQVDADALLFVVVPAD